MFVHFIEDVRGSEVAFSIDKINYIHEQGKETTYIGLDKNTVFIVRGSLEEVETKINEALVSDSFKFIRSK